MISFILSLLLNGLTVLLVANFLDGVTVISFTDAVIVGVVLGLLNTLVKPIVKLLTLPINLMTLGLFTLVINGALVLVADHLLQGFMVEGFIMAIIFSVLLAILNSILGIFT